MLEMAPVIIVSAFGRGLWLAESLIQKSIPVKWVDVTDQLGRQELVDIEGPFPMIDSIRLSAEEKEFWLQGGGVECRPLSDGLTFLTRQGPIEMGGEFLSGRLSALGLAPENIEYLDEEVPQKQVIKLQDRLKKMNLSESWVALWSHRFTSLQDMAPMLSMNEGQSLPLNKTIWTRRPRPVAESLKKLSSEELFDLFADVDAEDIAFLDRKTPSGLLIKKDTSELVPCSNLVWALTSAETKFLSPHLSERIFRSEAKELNKVWIRWQISITGLGLPTYFIVLNDPELPWEHQNLLIFSQSRGSGSYSVWMLLPAAQRFNRSYLDHETEELLRFLKERFVSASVELVAKPLELTATTRELGISLFGLFREGEFQKNILPAWNHFYQLGPESQMSQGPNGSLQREDEVERDISGWWKREQEIRAKREARNKPSD